MNRDAPPSRSTADRLTEPVSALDHGTNTVHDALNDAVPWLWWPLTVPPAERRLGAREHALYAVHAGLGIAAAGLVGRRRARNVGAGVVVAFASWALFTGAWDRRADQSASSDRRAT
jgi:hypothetical protein